MSESSEGGRISISSEEYLSFRVAEIDTKLSENFSRQVKRSYIFMAILSIFSATLTSYYMTSLQSRQYMDRYRNIEKEVFENISRVRLYQNNIEDSFRRFEKFSDEIVLLRKELKAKELETDKRLNEILIGLDTALSSNANIRKNMSILEERMDKISANLGNLKTMMEKQ